MKTVAFYTLGCKVNIYESNALMNVFKNEGFEIISNEMPADAYIINTCSVTNQADAKSKKIIRHARKLNPNAVICVMGCFAQTNPEAQEMEEIDILLGNGNKSMAPTLVKKALESNEKIEKINLLKIRNVNDYENLEATTFDHTRAFIKIEDGCSNFCSYCIIPYARGPVRSKDKGLVIAEMMRVAKMGYKEVVLAGIHTGHYSCGDNYHFSDLLRDIIKEVPEIERLRISSIEMNEITEDVLNLMRESKVIVDHIHLPLQAGCDKILKLMNRKYNTAQFLEKVNEIRAVRPDISLTTDVIVGFPYETDEDFNDTVEFIKKVNFAELHVFPFSPRTGTPAFKMPKVNDQVKKDRVHVLLDLSKELNKSYCEKFIGKTLDVLVETVYDEKYMIGHTSNYLSVLVPLDSTKIGQIVNVKLEKLADEHIIGNLA